MQEINQPIFIFCLHRSGSTYLKNIIDSSKEVKMFEDEVHFDHPLFKNTYRKYYKKFCGDKTNKYDVFLNKMTNKKLRGSFWRFYKQKYGGFSKSRQYMDPLDNISLQNSFSSIIKHVLSETDKDRVGIKYPAHHCYVSFFIKHYPDSKLVFLIREPKSIIASKILSPTNQRLNKSSKLQYEVIRLFTLFYFSWEFKTFIKVVTANNKKAYSIKYEDLVSNPRASIANICSFLNLSFAELMLQTKGKSSGYEKNLVANQNKWKHVLRKYERFLINILTKNARKKIGYV
jgi:hypothetical protein